MWLSFNRLLQITEICSSLRLFLWLNEFLPNRSISATLGNVCEVYMDCIVDSAKLVEGSHKLILFDAVPQRKLFDRLWNIVFDNECDEINVEAHEVNFF